MNITLHRREVDIVTGKSPLKLEALRRASKRAGLKARIITEDTESQVNAQPEEHDETMSGANTRAKQLAKKHPRAYAVGIESGAFKNADNLNDKGGIVIYYPDDGGRGDLDRPTPNTEKYKRTGLTAAGPNFPPEAVTIARRRGFKTTTIGSVMEELYGSPGDNPHEYLSNNHADRGDFLEATLLSMMLDIVAHLDAQVIDLSDEGEPAYTVQVESPDLVVRLPIRQADGGPKLAFFDLLCVKALKAKVNKRLAEKLLMKIPAGAELLVVPEGKSVALAMYLADLSGLELVVLRKKNREVNPAILSEPYESITSKGVQHLHATRDQKDVFDDKVALVFDDVISGGGTALACENIALKLGASEVTHLYVFTEGNDWESKIKPERVIALANLPIPAA